MGRIAYDDVRTLTANRIAADCGRLPSVIVGSPPCQDASVANTTGRGVDGERTGLFFDAIRLVGECRPVWACFENVPGLRTRGADRVLAALEALGYTCWPLVVGAWHAGAPHRRNRVWIVAADSNCSPWPVWEGVSRDVDQAITPIERGPLRSRHAIEAAACGHLRVFDGVPDWLAVACADAYGDAVVPQITEAIGRVMMRLLPTDGTVLDLFSGAAGGWSLGLHRAGYRTIAFCEIDDWRRAVFSLRCQV